MRKRESGEERKKRGEKERKKKKKRLMRAWVATRECTIHIGWFFHISIKLRGVFNTFTRRHSASLRVSSDSWNCRVLQCYCAVAFKPILSEHCGSLAHSRSPNHTTLHWRSHQSRWLRRLLCERKWSHNRLVVNRKTRGFLFRLAFFFLSYVFRHCSNA